ncbi:MAG: monovalent cation/H(+) antiporter subunit G [Acidimicrobiales bacterium]|nr:monovalent cation/H(+) antiporter subunit G [Acidimicrobiales bacterium]
MIGSIVVLAGAALTLLSAIGVVRFPEVMARMHSLTKASTLGYALVSIGVALQLSNTNDATTALLAGALQIVTLPLAANLIGRATHLTEGTRIEAIDELAEARERQRDAPG